MEYVISDIHGYYDLFIKLLEKINFSQNDKMIIVGDIFDKGPDSIKLLKFIRQYDNFLFVIGNHEYEFLKYYHNIMKDTEDNFDEEEVLKRINDYFKDEELKLDWEDLDWLENCPFYYETDDYTCVHAGIKLNEKNEIISPEQNEVEYLVYDRHFKEPNVIVNNSKCVFYGHTPTRYLTDKDEIITYKRDNVIEAKSIKDFYKIHLDCGTYYSKKLGCFCIENCQTYYI